MAVVAKNKADEGKVAQSMQRLMEEDPTIRFEQNKETRQQVLTGLGDQHLDVIVSKLANKFGVEISLEKAKVPYREDHPEEGQGTGTPQEAVGRTWSVRRCMDRIRAL